MRIVKWNFPSENLNFHYFMTFMVTPTIHMQLSSSFVRYLFQPFHRILKLEAHFMKLLLAQYNYVSLFCNTLKTVRFKGTHVSLINKSSLLYYILITFHLNFISKKRGETSTCLFI
jgi:hypothetical protein